MPERTQIMLDKVERWIDDNQLLAAGDRVLIACSGGADSVALVHVMNILRQKYSWLLSVAHVNHLIRGQEGFEDAAFVAEFCRSLALELFSTEVDAPSYAEANSLSLEEAARNLRYRYLHSVASSLGRAKIATAHTQDDQAETILLHFLRGAGGQGLQGMQPQAGAVVRPFLAVTRREIELYCHDNQLSFQTDSSNACIDFTRNRIRLRLLPFLEREFNPNIRKALLRTASLMTQEHGYITEQAAEAWQALASPAEDGWSLSLEALRKLNPALRREVFRITFQKIVGNLKGISFRHVEILDRACQIKGPECRIDLPAGLSAWRSYNRLVLQRTPRSDCQATVLPDTELPVPGRIKLADGRFIAAEITQSPGNPPDAWTAIFAAASLAPPLIVGARRPGDRFQPRGFTGTKKVKDFLIDSKVPRSERDMIPVVRDSKGILWLCGLRQAERGAPVELEHTQKFVKLTILDPREEA